MTRCELCGMNASDMREHLGSAHPTETWPDAYRSRPNLEDWRLIGPGRSTLYALAIWPVDVASRATLRALLPQGRLRDLGVSGHARRMMLERGSKRVNVTSLRFQDALKRMEDAGAIQRGTEFVQIRDRRWLIDHALDGITNPSHRKFLAIERAVEIVAAELTQESRPTVREARRRELEFIRSLMVAPVVGQMRSGTQSVRFVGTGQRP